MPFLVIQTGMPVFSTSITSAVRVSFAFVTVMNFNFCYPLSTT